MTKVLVTTNPNPILFTEIDLSDKKWLPLCVDQLPPFKIEEQKRACSAYPNGIFPGAKDNLNGKQTFRIHNFHNYVEFSKIVSNEIVPISGQYFLTTKFYDRRKEGWESDKYIKKKGKILGYCLNGDVYSVSCYETVEKIFYEIVYQSLVQKNPAFISLQQYLRDGICLILTGADGDFLGYLAEVLLISIQAQ